MRQVQITEICDIQVGKTPFRSNPSYWGEGSLWLSIADMNQGSILEYTKETITPIAVKECNCKMIPPNTVLFSFKLSIGKVGITKVPMYTNEAIAAFIIKNPSELDTSFLFYALKSMDHSIGSNKAVMGKTLNKEQLKKIKIPLPPVEEQKQVVKILHEADILCKKRKNAIELIDDYLKSVFLEIFGDPVANPKEWNKKELKFFGDVITGNTPSRKNNDNYSSDFIEWIKTDNIVEDNVCLTQASEYLSEEGLKRSRSVKPGAVLTACIAGSIASIGRVAITDRKVSFNQQINAIQPNEKVNSLFLYWLLKNSRSYIQDHATRGMKRILTKGEFEKINMIIPPLDLQNKFANTARKAESLKQKMLEQSNALNNQFQALMQKYFNSN